MKTPSMGVRRSVVVSATITLAIALFVGALVLRAQLRESLEASISDQTLTRAESVASLVATGDFEEVLRPSARTPTWVQVIGDDGTVFAATPNVSKLTKPFAPFVAINRPQIRRMRGLVIDTGERVAVASVPVQEQGRRLTVLAASPLDLADATDATVVRLILILFSVLLLFASLVVWMSTRRALRPVEAIRLQVAAITATDLSRRVPVPPADDEVARLATTMNETLDRLELAAARQRRFVSDAGHELRSPLASLRNQLEASIYDRPDPEWAATVADMRIDHERLERLVTDLLLLARHDEHKTIAHEPLDLGYLVRHEIARRPDCDRIERIVEAQNVIIEGDSDALVRVLRNLVDNAERHAVSKVWVSVTSSSGVAVMSVEDDGPGIAVADQAKVFDRFYRLDEARSADAGGSGLGLAIVNELVGRHRGTVAMEEGKGGARFVVRIPILVAKTVA